MKQQMGLKRMQREKPKLLIIYGPLLHYRVGLFNEIIKRFNLTVITTDPHGDYEKCGFKVKSLKLRHFGFLFYRIGLRRFLRGNKFNVAILFADKKNLDVWTLAFFPLTSKTIIWGAWFPRNWIVNFFHFEGQTGLRSCLDL